MKLCLVSAILLCALCAQSAIAQTAPPGQYCPLASDFDVRPETLTPGGHIGYFLSVPISYTVVTSFSIDESARVINLVGRSYIIGVGIPPPNPIPGGFGPVTPGPYHLIVKFFYYDAQSVRQECPTLDIPFTVGSGPASATPVPAMSTWMLMALAGVLGGLGFAAQRHVRRRYSGH